MSGMTPAVRRALGLAPKLPKRVQNIPKNIPAAYPDHFAAQGKKVPSGMSVLPGPPDSAAKVGKEAQKMTIYEENHQALTATVAPRISPATCPYPDDLCRGCREFERCG
ncbi:MAG: hypothetical protein M1438_09615 [Deltaproteobacteria bacterium]|nr:hypothetical protein [Deltaproteobacteria bacterium]